MYAKSLSIWWLIGFGISITVLILVLAKPAALARMATSVPQPPCEELMHCSDGAPLKPIYPSRPLPANSRDVTVEMRQEGRYRITLFTTTMTRAEVFAFYQQELEANGWELYQTKPDWVEYVYANTLTTPVFNFSVMILSETANLTEVKLRHGMSGPFTARDWPQY